MSTFKLDDSGMTEVKGFMEQENQRYQLQQVINRMSEMCWEKCVPTPDRELSKSERTCISNCVDRFLDTNVFVANRITKQKK